MLSQRHPFGAGDVNALGQRESALRKENGHVGANLFPITGHEIPDVLQDSARDLDSWKIQGGAVRLQEVVVAGGVCAWRKNPTDDLALDEQDRRLIGERGGDELRDRSAREKNSGRRSSGVRRRLQCVGFEHRGGSRLGESFEVRICDVPDAGLSPKAFRTLTER